MLGAVPLVALVPSVLALEATEILDAVPESLKLYPDPIRHSIMLDFKEFKLYVAQMNMEIPREEINLVGTRFKFDTSKYKGINFSSKVTTIKPDVVRIIQDNMFKRDMYKQVDAYHVENGILRPLAQLNNVFITSLNTDFTKDQVMTSDVTFVVDSWAKV